MKRPSGSDKLRGGYYTPKDLADFIVGWVNPRPGESILEPSCGDGVFLESLRQFGGTYDITAVELDKAEAVKSSKIVKVFNDDFFSFYEEHILKQRSFDVLLGNPPFIRYQSFDHEYREVAFRLMSGYGFKPNKMTNIWVPFLLLSSEALTDNGRIGMVIPAELFQVNYAEEARRYLLSKFDRLTILMFNKLLFDDAQQEIVVLLGEVTSDNPGIYTIEVTNLDQLKGINHTTISQNELRRFPITSGKWTPYYLTNYDVCLLDNILSMDGVHLADELLDANVGIVTGDNDFFLLTKDDAEARGLENTLPIVSRSEYLKGLRFTQDDIKAIGSSRRVKLFSPPDVDIEFLSESERKYLDVGKESGTNQCYKCRIRKRWYVVPRTWSPEAFFFRQVGDYPRIVVNETSALTTDTLHKVRFKTGISPSDVAISMLNSYTLLNCELIGRSYGGGVLTFEPSEVRKIPIPIVKHLPIDYEMADRLVREGRIEELIMANDRGILEEQLGISHSDVAELNLMWRKLKNRRSSRRRA